MDDLAKKLHRFPTYEEAAAYLETRAMQLAKNLSRGDRSPDNSAKTKTTIVAFETKDGAIVAADSRVTWGYYKPGISAVTKLYPLLNCATVGFAGDAADAQLMALLLEEDFEMHRNFTGSPMSPRTMANRVNVYSRYFPWTVPLFAVFDPSKKRARLFEYGGGFINESGTGYNGVGSGFEAIEAMAAEKASAIKQLTAKEAKAVVEEIMVQAVVHDSFTGGPFRFHLLTIEGIEQVLVPEHEWRLRHDLIKIMDDIARGKMRAKEAALVVGILVEFSRKLNELTGLTGTATKAEGGAEDGQ